LIVQDLRRDPVDVVQSQHFYTNVYAAAAARAAGVPGIGAIRSNVFSEVEANRGWLGVASLRLPQYLAANSQRAIENAVSLGVPRAKLRVLRNAVDVTQFKGGERSEAGRFRLLTVGRLVAAKRYDRLLRLLSRLKSTTGGRVTGSIYGDGVEESSLRGLAADLGLSDTDLRMLPGTPEIARCYHDADAFVLTSDYEGTPNVVLEAMAAGLPVVATDVGGVREIIEHGVNGLIVPAHDEDALHSAVLELIGSPELRDRLSRSAARRVTEEFSTSHLPEQLAELYETAGAARSRDGTRGVESTARKLRVSKSLRVMQLTDTLAIGGAERVACGIANELHASGHVAHFCTTRESGPLEQVLAAGVHRLHLNRRRRLDVGALYELARHIRKYQIEVLHAHGTAVFMAAVVAVLVPGTRIVWHLHFGRLATDDDPGRAFRVIRRRVSHVLAASEPLAAWARSRIGVPVHQVTYVPNFPTIPGIEARPAELPGLRGQRVICVANIVPVKGHQILVRAFRKVVARFPDARLFLVGHALNLRHFALVREEVRKSGLENHVHFLGQIEDIWPYLLAADIGVLASWSEGMPLALLEYGAARLASVTTEVGQCRDVLEHGSAGLLVPPGEPSALADALEQLLDDSAQRSMYGSALQRTVSERFYSARSVAVITELYRSLLK